jgi:hypothetical protein
MLARQCLLPAPGRGRTIRHCAGPAPGRCRPGAAGSPLRLGAGHSHVPHFVGELVEGGVAVDLVGGRVEHMSLSPGSLAVIWSRAPPRCSRLPGGGCRRRAPSAAPWRRRPRAGCRSACGPGLACCGRRLPTGAILAGCGGAHGVCLFMLHARLVVACGRGPARPRAPRRRRPRPSRGWPGARGCRGRCR